MITNIFMVVIFIWLITTSVCLALLYKDYINLKYSNAADKIVKRPDTEYIVPGRGFFSVKKKRAAICNDDRKAYLEEQKGVE